MTKEMLEAGGKVLFECFSEELTSEECEELAGLVYDGMVDAIDIERVARAICAADGETWPTEWDASEEVKATGLRHRLELGQAAIAAMCDPPGTDAMEITTDLVRDYLNGVAGVDEEFHAEETRMVGNIVHAIEAAEARGAAQMRERALKWVDAIHEGKDGSRDPAVFDNVCIRIKHAIQSLPDRETDQ